MSEIKLSDQEFNNLRQYINEIIGFSLGDDKRYLVQQRLEPILKEQGCKSYGEFYQKLKKKSDFQLQNKIIAAITTNETSFFRDSHPFETFRSFILPQLFLRVKERKIPGQTRRGAKVRIWSSAASTGQEPYSIAMLILDTLSKEYHPNVQSGDFSILASDISTEVLSKAMKGTFKEMDMERGLNTYYRDRYFVKNGTNEITANWFVKEEVQKLIEFKRINLAESFGFVGSFDVIFCRNVLIYFDINIKTKIIEQFHHLLNPEGFLVLGTSENLYGLTDKFESEHHGSTILYRKKKG